jgi:serine/threonine protein phosphatase PrpC
MGYKDDAPTKDITNVMISDITFASLTDVGLVRDHNEDYYGFFEPDGEGLLRTKGRLFVVADGMGGHAAGEVASQIAVKTIGKVYFSVGAHVDITEALRTSIEAANGEIIDEARRNPEKEGMGTTVSALSLVGNSAVVANVGDSRTYLIRDNGITQISHDHSWVMEQVRAGELTPEQAENHPYGNVITRNLGSKTTVEVDTFGPIDVMSGDIFLLMSDGLSGLVKDSELLEFATSLSPKKATEKMVELAKERGGHDNITIQIVKINGVVDEMAGKTGVIRVSKRPLNIVAVALAFLTVVLVVAAVFLLPKLKKPIEPSVDPPPGFDIDVVNPVGMVFGDGMLHILDKVSIVTCDPILASDTEESKHDVNKILLPEEIGKPLAIMYIETLPTVKILEVMGILEKGEKRKDTISFSTYNLNKSEWSHGAIFKVPVGKRETPSAMMVLDNNIYFIFSGRLFWASTVGKSKIEEEWELEDPTVGFAFPFYENDLKFVSPPGFIYMDGGRFNFLHAGERVPREICPDSEPLSIEIVDMKMIGKGDLSIASTDKMYRVDLIKKEIYKVPASPDGLSGNIVKIAIGGDVLYLLVKGDDSQYKIVPVGDVHGVGAAEPLCK